MRRLCGRPGCSAPASVTFTFDATRCVVWLNPIADGTARAGDLCTRHADALVPPQGWECVDRRPARAVAVLDVVGPSEPPPVGAEPDDLLPHRDPSKRKRRKRWSEVPSLFDEGVAPAAIEAEAGEQPGLEVAGDAPEPAWLPRFADDDDLDGILDADTPLLARAFRNAKPHHDEG